MPDPYFPFDYPLKMLSQFKSISFISFDSLGRIITFRSTTFFFTFIFFHNFFNVVLYWNIRRGTSFLRSPKLTLVLKTHLAKRMGAFHAVMMVRTTFPLRTWKCMTFRQISSVKLVRVKWWTELADKCALECAYSFCSMYSVFHLLVADVYSCVLFSDHAGWLSPKQNTQNIYHKWMNIIVVLTYRYWSFDAWQCLWKNPLLDFGFGTQQFVHRWIDNMSLPLHCSLQETCPMIRSKFHSLIILFLELMWSTKQRNKMGFGEQFSEGSFCLPWVTGKQSRHTQWNSQKTVFKT